MHGLLTRPSLRTRLSTWNDIIGIEKLYNGSGKTIYSQKKTTTKVHAIKYEDIFKRVKEKGESIGMRMNDNKTQLVCITAATSSEVTAFIRLSDGEIKRSQTSLKQLGFHSGTKPLVNEHVFQLKRKFRGRLWVLRHLQKAGLDTDHLLAMYKCFLRSLIDYAAVVIHPMLTAEQEKELESLQGAALRAQRLINLEIPVLVQSLKPSNVELG